MPESAARELADYLTERAGRAVRSVAFYDEDDLEILHMRDDIRPIYSEERLADIAEIFRDELRRKRAERTFKMGDFRCSLLGFSEGIALHFPQGGSQGTVITLDAEVSRQFNAFVEECAERIYGD